MGVMERIKEIEAEMARTRKFVFGCVIWGDCDGLKSNALFQN